jgi:Flp pilus assembly protein TadD
MANVYNAMDDSEGYLAVVKKGRMAYPEDADLIVYELNYYLRNGQFEEAENNLKLAIEKEPMNKQLHFSLGVVYDNLGQTDKAAIAYEEAIEIDPDYFDAVYNLGALYFNQGVEMNNAANEIEDNKKYEAKKAEAKASFVEALPYLEKAHELDPKDLGAMQSLKTLYASIGQTDKYKEIKAKMDNM